LGGVSAAPQAPKASAPVPMPKAPPTPPKTEAAPGAATSTMEACWDEFCKAHDNMGEPDLVGAWYAAIKKATGKEQNDCNPGDWGKMLASIDRILMK